MSRRRRRSKFRTSRKFKVLYQRVGSCLLLVFALVGIITTVRLVGSMLADITEADEQAADSGTEVTVEAESTGKKISDPPAITEKLLTPNEYSRAQLPLKSVKGVVVHYTGNPNTTAEENRNYFENLAKTHTTKASSHYIIGMDGEIIRCIPENEMSYASNHRNSDTISIECCHPYDDGSFTQNTYSSLIRLVSYLMGKYDLTLDQVIRHYDVSGKSCPKYYVENPDAWQQFKYDVNSYINTYGE